jgi:hypothetical protein
MEPNVGGYNTLHQLIYISRGRPDLYIDQSECVNAILRSAARNNKRLGITGALLACDDWFLQVLEGKRIDVDTLYERIARDPAHGDIRKIASRPIADRGFAAWSMCASTLSSTDKAIVEALKGKGRFDPATLNADRAMQLLMAVGRLQTAGAPGRV